MSGASRLEVDFAGEVAVDADALWGAQTARALDTFTISDLRLPRSFVHTLGALKRAAACTNQELGLLEPHIADAIVEAAGEVATGRLDAHFRIDLFQTGSGTNTNMNANEVIANRANQLLGSPLGSKSPVHPNDHVNLGQSSNDVTPTVMHIAAQAALAHRLVPALAHLDQQLTRLADDTDHVVKPGRTHLQDAVPIRLGQEFRGHAGQIERGISRIRKAQADLSEVALGGTAVGTGINTHPQFAERVIRRLADEFDIEIKETQNHFQAQNTLDAIVFTSGALRTVAVSLMKIADDVRWMSSGPRAGLAEITVPSLGMGSSIMPGKTNPIVAEAVSQVAVKVIGNDATITASGSRANFEITVMSPVAAHALLESIDVLTGACTVFTDRCLAGVEATGAGPRAVERSLMLATALSPKVGYDAAARVARRAAEDDSTVIEAARKLLDLPEHVLQTALDPFALTARSDPTLQEL